MKGYKGNKGFQKAYMEIINLIPPHKRYYELFAGSAGIYKNIYPSEKSFLNDLCSKAYTYLTTLANKDTIVYNTNALKLLMSILPGSKDDFVYLDPPYPLSSIGSKKPIYDFTLTDDEHMQLLTTIQDAKFNCMISTYENEMYNEYLKDWNKYSFKTSVQGNVKNEILFFNYDFPKELHDYRYLGKDNTDRQRINRKVNRELLKLESLPPLERNKIINAINNKFLMIFK